MANEIARGGVGNFWFDAETALGTAAGAPKGIRPEATPEMPTSPRKLIANSNAGHRHPLNTEAKPIAVEVFRENALKFSTRIRRASADGATTYPSIGYFLESGGWTRGSSTDTTIDDVAPDPGEFDLAADTVVAGQAILVELPSGAHVPCLVAHYASPEVTPGVELSATPANGAAVTAMHTYTPATSTTYQVPTNKTLTFIYNSLGYYTAGMDASYTFNGCSLTEIGALEIGAVGTAPTMAFGFHVGKVVGPQSDAIGADSFHDSAPFAVVTDDMEFAIVDADYTGGISLLTKCIKSATVNFGLATTPIGCVGGGSFAGLQGYMLVQTPPTITIDGFFTGDTTISKEVFDELVGSNTSKHVHLIQPTRDVDSPAWGVWLPNCHLQADAEPTIQFEGDDNTIRFQATFEADLAGFDSLSDIDEVEASPIFFAISGEVS